MKNFHVVALLALTTVVASFNANAASFDCAKASTAVEGSICANAGLSALDEQLAASYARARTSSANVEALRNAQMDWMKQRNTCGANVECLTTSYKLRIAALVPSTIAPANNGIQSLNGKWYSAQWKYGYTLQNGVGVATSTNSPNFQVGQNIIQLTATAPNKFSGQQVYTDGKFYNVTATLQPDGSLYFEGDKNVKWTMTKVGTASAPVAAVPYAPAQQPQTNIESKLTREQNEERWFNKYLTDANNGDLAAINWVGTFYKYGQMGRAINIAEAKKWFELGASKGYSGSMLSLGMFYENGADGIPKDIEKAKSYYTQAAKLGSQKAQERLSALNPQQFTASSGTLLADLFKQRWRLTATAACDEAGGTYRLYDAINGRSFVISGKQQTTPKPPIVEINETNASNINIRIKLWATPYLEDLLKEKDLLAGELVLNFVRSGDGVITEISQLTQIDVESALRGIKKYVTEPDKKGVLIACTIETSTPQASATKPSTGSTASAPALKQLLSDGFCMGYLTGAVRFKEDVTPRPITNRMQRAFAKNKILASKIDAASQKCAAQTGANETEIEKSLSCYQNSFIDSEERAFATGVQKGLVLTYARTPTAFDAKTACADFE